MAGGQSRHSTAAAPEGTIAARRAPSRRAIGTILLGDGAMPAFDNTLTDQQIADVVAYVKTL